MDALALSGVPVPRMHVLCEDESVIGRAFYVMECVEGRVLWDQSLPGMAPDERSAVYDEMNRVLAALHNVDVRAVGLAEFGRPGNYFGRQISRWTRQYQASITEPIPDSSSHSTCMRGTGTPLKARASMTRYSRSIAWADGNSLARGPGLLRIT